MLSKMLTLLLAIPAINVVGYLYVIFLSSSFFEVSKCAYF
ncbi:hypothetical protein UYSO10_0853 [Kosakonia radicincitans]|nr:hypothetical protein UYSO10_0853 [Kosakonia radicincitans]